MSNWEHAPWMIGGGVEHPVEMARLLAYAAFGGGEGIIGPDDLKVQARVTPDGTIRVAPGACAILNRGTNVKYEAYAGRLPIEDYVAITPTGSGAGRTDMIIARVEDPFQPGEPWTVPSGAAIQTTQYIQTAVVPNVSPTARTLADIPAQHWSAIPLALVTLPASTATVLQTHITDLRFMYKAQTETAFNIARPAATRTLTSDSYVEFPTDFTTPVKIPPWATHVSLRAILGGVRYGASGSNGGAGWGAVGALRLNLGGIVTPGVTYNVSVDAGVDSQTLMTGGSKVAIPANMRGTTVDLNVEGYKTSGSTSISLNTSSVGSLEAVFVQAAA